MRRSLAITVILILAILTLFLINHQLGQEQPRFQYRVAAQDDLATAASPETRPRPGQRLVPEEDHSQDDATINISRPSHDNTDPTEDTQATEPDPGLWQTEEERRLAIRRSPAYEAKLQRWNEVHQQLRRLRQLYHGYREEEMLILDELRGEYREKRLDFVAKFLEQHGEEAEIRDSDVPGHLTPETQQVEGKMRTSDVNLSRAEIGGQIQILQAEKDLLTAQMHEMMTEK